MRGILSRAYARGGEVVGLPSYGSDTGDDYGDYFKDPNAQDSGVLNNQARSDSVPVTGAIAPRVNPADAQRLSDIDRASQRIEEMQQAREASRNGGVNLPLLAAAGAMLAPTKTGGFGESLSNSIGAAVPLAQKDRALEEQTQMRMAQQEWNAAVKKAELADRSEGRTLQDRRDTNTERHQRAMEELATRRAEIYANRGNTSQDKFVSTGQVDEQGRLILQNGAGEIKYGPVIGVKPGDRLKDDTNRWKVDQNNDFRYTKLDNDSQIADRRLQLQQQGMDSTEAARKARLEFDQQKEDHNRDIRERTLDLRSLGISNKDANDKARIDVAQERTRNAKYDKPILAHTVSDDGEASVQLVQQDKSNGQWVTADENRNPVAGVKSIMKGDAPDPEQIKTTAAQIAKYNMAPLSGFTMKTPYGQAVMAEVVKQNPNYDDKDYAASKRAVTQFASGPQGNTVRSLNVAVAHLETLRELSEALKNKDGLRMFNNIANRWGAATGQAPPNNFDAAKQVIGQELVKAVVGAGGGGVQERVEAAEKMLASSSPAQFEGAINTYITLLGGQLGGLRNQYQGATFRDDFDRKYLTEESRKALGIKLENGGNSTPRSSDSRSNTSPAAVVAWPTDPSKREFGKVYEGIRLPNGDTVKGRYTKGPDGKPGIEVVQ